MYASAQLGEMTPLSKTRQKTYQATWLTNEDS